MKVKNTNIVNRGSQNTHFGKPKSHIMITLPLHIHSQVEALAEKEERSLSFICRRFVEQGLEAKPSHSLKKN